MHISSLLFLISLPLLAVSQATSSNLQPFTGTLGGAAPPVTNSGDPKRQFEVNGNTFVNFAAAAQRSCAIQHNACADAANSGKGGSVGACDTQEGGFPPLKIELVEIGKS